MRVFSLLSFKEMPLVGISQEVLGYEKLRVILPRVRVKAAFEWEERAQSQAVHLGGGVPLKHQGPGPLSVPHLGFPSCSRSLPWPLFQQNYMLTPCAHMTYSFPLNTFLCQNLYSSFKACFKRAFPWPQPTGSSSLHVDDTEFALNWKFNVLIEVILYGINNMWSGICF